MDVFLKLSQFDNTDSLFAAINGTLVDPTVSLCHQCHQHIPAYTYHKDNQLWLVKRCKMHGITHHMIERDYQFISSLTYTTKYRFNDSILIEVSDRCNADCPHCYHMPDNKVIDKPISEILSQIEKFYVPGTSVCLTGAEASLRKDFPALISAIVNKFDYGGFGTMTNGIRFANIDFLKECRDSGLQAILVGLNHPSYLNNETIRAKQLAAITNANSIGMSVGYIGYTMASISELEDILEESTVNDWHPGQYRIRYGSDIGRYPDQERMYLSDIYKITQAWCERKGKSFKIIDNADNNIYHVMVDIEGQEYRLIQWCDETDIHMEELRTGPWCDFVPDGITNFLHQIIRRDIWKNQGLVLPDAPPVRYQFAGRNDKSPLDFNSLY